MVERWICDHNVCRCKRLFFRKTPDMELVHRDHARDFFKVVFDVFNIDADRG
jgi:hypothetical protein